MLNLVTSSQIRDADAHTISVKAISSLDLMETAAKAFIIEFKKEVPDKNIPIDIFCGIGNNGGDGLAIARLLKEDAYTNLYVKIVRFSNKSSRDFDTNLVNLKQAGIPITELSKAKDLFKEPSEVVIDALLGTGMTKPIDGSLKSIIEYINNSGKKIISVDIPSGFPSEGIILPDSITIKANIAISFQRPKINFFFPESAMALERFRVTSIGLDEDYIQSLTSYFKLIEETDILNIVRLRKPFSHKGTYGHALIIAGSRETMGAALLSADACLHSGAGLTTACIPESGLIALNTRSPEIMALIRDENLFVKNFHNYSSIAFGPGTGTDNTSIKLFRKILTSGDVPMVFDADALTILSNNTELFNELPSMSILTPHMKEFDRMFGQHTSWWARIETARNEAQKLQVIILLKNQYSFIVLPDGNVLINPTGNPAMAVGGMGDILTGMIAAFLAQGYPAQNAAILACYLHGKAGDELKEEGMNSIPPRYLVKRLPFVVSSHNSLSNP